jgi:hypothetical protein
MRGLDARPTPNSISPERDTSQLNTDYLTQVQAYLNVHVYYFIIALLVV